MASIVLPVARVRFTSGTLEALKWFALVCMLVDHANTVLFDRTLGDLAMVVGRLAFPIFAIVFGYNLARRNADPPKLAIKLVVLGLLSSPLYAPLLGVWPVNILFTLALAALVVAWQRGWYAWFEVWPTVIVGGALVDYLWPGVALVVGASMYFRRPGPAGLSVMAFAFAGMCLLNPAAPWSLLALPVLLAASRIDLAVPRWRWAFHLAYPLHLAALCIMQGVGV